MTFLFVLLVSLCLASLLAHGVHWAVHQRWAGYLRRAHMDHHLQQYPPGDLLSVKYRHAKWYHSGALLFTTPLVIVLSAIMVVCWFLGVPGWLLLTFAAVMVAFGLLNDFVHDSSHVQDHWMGRFAWFRRLQAVHFKHHHNMKRNFGIVTFVWDRLFGTYKDL